jgi:hypothetical protein
MNTRKLAGETDSKVWAEEFRKDLVKAGCPVDFNDEFLESWFKLAIGAGYNRRDDEVMGCLV